MIAGLLALDHLEDLAALAALATGGDDHLVALLQSEFHRHGMFL
jgi:hypothetical protein